EAKSKVLILLTDGVSNAGDISPLQAADLAKSLGIKIYTIGAGTRGAAPYRVDHPLFGTRYQQQEVEIDEETLRSVAETTGGAYFRAEDADGLMATYEQIDAMEKSDFEGP